MIGAGALTSMTAEGLKGELISTTAADYGVYAGIVIGSIGVVAKLYDSYTNHKHLKSIERLRERELDIEQQKLNQSQ